MLYSMPRYFIPFVIPAPLGLSIEIAPAIWGNIMRCRCRSQYSQSRDCSSRRLAFALPAFADNLTGQASIIDGDTVEIHGTRIRLWGVDAPESNQLCRGDDSIQYRCGAKAANDLDSFLNKRPIDCAPVTLDQYRRTVAVCSVDGVDLADWLVRNGLALD
jgi:endonuclease YncB( thermonuclease family)